MASKGKPKPKLRDLSRVHPTSEEAEEAWEAHYSGDPLVAAILGQAMVEVELDLLLRQQFKRNDDDVWRELTDDRGPMGTFWAKIVAGYGFGLYDEVTRDHLNRIRNVRNAFAHAKRKIDFDEPLISKEIRGALLPLRPHSRLYKRILSVHSADNTDREAYMFLCGGAYMALIKRRTRALAAAIRNKDRKILRMLRATNPLVGLFNQSQPNALAGYAEWSRPNRTDGPNRLALEAGLGEFLSEPPKPGDNGGK